MSDNMHTLLSRIQMPLHLSSRSYLVHVKALHSNDTASNLQGKNGCMQTMKTRPAASFTGFKFFVSQWIGAVNHIDLAIVNLIPMHVNISRLVQLSCSFNFTINCDWQLSPAVHSIHGRTCYDFESVGNPSNTLVKHLTGSYITLTLFAVIWSALAIRVAGSLSQQGTRQLAKQSEEPCDRNLVGYWLHCQMKGESTSMLGQSTVS